MLNPGRPPDGQATEMQRPLPNHIQILHFERGAARAQGVAVVIDVLRAFTTACYVAAGGARRILATAAQDRAVRLRKRYPGAILVGERNGRRLPGFDAGNSPHQAQFVDWRDRTVLFTTSNGTQGLIAARGARQVLCGSFVNAGATVAYLRRCAPAALSLVCMGSGGRPAVEDTLCAYYLRASLLGRPADAAAIRRKIMASGSAAEFRHSPYPDMPPEDLDLCLALDRFGFVLRTAAGPEGSVRLERVDVND